MTEETNPVDFWEAIHPAGIVSMSGGLPAASDVPKNSIGATSDHEAVVIYLEAMEHSESTRAMFLTQLARWTWFLRRQGITSYRDATLKTVRAFQQWLSANPVQYDDNDVGSRAALLLSDGSLNPAWRPLKPSHQPMAKATVAKDLSYLSAFYTWLCKGGYITGASPFGLSRNKTRDGDLKPGDADTSKPYLKALSFESLKVLYEYLNSSEYIGFNKHRVADWWLITLLYWTAHRVTAMVSLEYHRHIQSVEGGLELAIIGKGSKRLRQTFPEDLHRGYQLYRSSLGLPPIPEPGEVAPLYFGKRRPPEEKPHTEGYRFDRTEVYQRVRDIGKNAARWCVENEPGRLSHQEFDKLNNIGPHSLRHTRTSIMLNVLGHSLATVKEHLGHSNVVTTGQYWQADRRNRTGLAAEDAESIHRDIIFGLLDKLY